MFNHHEGEALLRVTSRMAGVALALETAPLGIRIVLVEPRGIATDWAGSSAAENTPSEPWAPTTPPPTAPSAARSARLLARACPANGLVTGSIMSRLRVLGVAS